MRFVRRWRCRGDDAAAATLLRCCACTAPLCTVAMTPGTSELDVLKCPQSILVVLRLCYINRVLRLQLRDETALQLVLPKFC